MNDPFDQSVEKAKVFCQIHLDQSLDFVTELRIDFGLDERSNLLFEKIDKLFYQATLESRERSIEFSQALFLSRGIIGFIIAGWLRRA